MPVVAESNIDGRAQLSTTDATITAQVRASGFRHLSLARKHRYPERIAFASGDFIHEDGDLYAVPTSNLYKYVADIFGDGVSLESFISESPKFIFPEVTNKKVPVRKVHSISFAPQYMATGSMQLLPDSVIVYGEPSRLENIGYVLTRPIELSGLQSSVHGKVKLDTPSGVRLSVQEVIYSMEVSRYVEISSDVKIETRNVPGNVELAVLPSSATAVFRCVFPLNVNPVGVAEFYVDYKDFVNSITGRCVAHCDNLPAGVISYSLEPEVFDCLARGPEQR